MAATDIRYHVANCPSATLTKAQTTNLAAFASASSVVSSLTSFTTGISEALRTFDAAEIANLKALATTETETGGSFAFAGSKIRFTSVSSMTDAALFHIVSDSASAVASVTTAASATGVIGHLRVKIVSQAGATVSGNILVYGLAGAT